MINQNEKIIIISFLVAFTSCTNKTAGIVLLSEAAFNTTVEGKQVSLYGTADPKYLSEYQKERWRKMQEILRTRTPLSAELLRAQSKRLAELVEKERNKSCR